MCLFPLMGVATGSDSVDVTVGVVGVGCSVP